MQSLKHHPEKVKKLFEHKNIEYINILYQKVLFQNEIIISLIAGVILKLNKGE